MADEAVNPEVRRILLSVWDFHLAAQFATRLGKLRRDESERVIDGDLIAALHIALVITYSRPFSGNRPDILTARSIKLDDLVDLTAAQLELHNTLLNQRHRMIAHSDPSKWRIEFQRDEGRVVPTVLDPREPLSVEDIGRIHDLAVCIENALSERLSSLGYTKRILEQMVM